RGQLVRSDRRIQARVRTSWGRRPRVTAGYDRFARIRVRDAPRDVHVVQPLVRDEGCRRWRDVSGGGVGRDTVRDADRFRDLVVRWRNGALADAANGGGRAHTGVALGG